MTELSKDDARTETLRRWRALPETDRTTFEQAELFAAALADDLSFRTMGNARKVILGWLTRDMDGLPPWGNVPPESEVSRGKEADMADPQKQKSTTDEQARDGAFLADNFAIAPQTAAGLVAHDGVAADDVEEQVRKGQQTGDEPTRDLIADNDEERQMPRTKVRNNRAGGG